MQSANVAQLVMVPGIITAASKPKHMANSVTVMCRDCRLETTVSATPGGGIVLPRKCASAPCCLHARGRQLLFAAVSRHALYAASAA